MMAIGQVLGTSVVECQDKFNANLLVLQLAGWNIQPEKTSSIPVQRLFYLGLITDTVEMKYYTSKEKIDLLSFMLNN